MDTYVQAYIYMILLNPAFKNPALSKRTKRTLCTSGGIFYLQNKILDRV